MPRYLNPPKVKKPSKKEVAKGQGLRLRLLLSQGFLSQARDYAAKVNLTALLDQLLASGKYSYGQGGRGSVTALADNGNESTLADLKLKNVGEKEKAEAILVFKEVMKSRGYVETGDGWVRWNGVGAVSGNVVRIDSPNGALTPGSLLGGATVAEMASGSVPEGIQEFKPAREVVPVGVRWAKVVREAVNRNLKEVRFEDSGLTDKLWVTNRENARGVARMGRVLAVKWNEDEVQGGWRVWYR